MGTNRDRNRELFTQFLGTGRWPLLHFDATASGVLVPESLRGRMHVVLQYKGLVTKDGTHINVTQSGVSAVLLLYHGECPVGYSTFVPWEAVYAVHASNDVSYSNDLPRELLAEKIRPGLQYVPAVDTGEPVEQVTKREPPKLKLVK